MDAKCDGFYGFVNEMRDAFGQLKDEDFQKPPDAILARALSNSRLLCGAIGKDRDEYRNLCVKMATELMLSAWLLKDRNGETKALTYAIYQHFVV